MHFFFLSGKLLKCKIILYNNKGANTQIWTKLGVKPSLDFDLNYICH